MSSQTLADWRQVPRYATKKRLMGIRVVAKFDSQRDLFLHLWVRYSIDRSFKRANFEMEKRLAKISLGLNYCSMCSSWLPSCDTVPLRTVTSQSQGLDLRTENTLFYCITGIILKSITVKKVCIDEYCALHPILI
jgi:hypothetical protein